MDKYEKFFDTTVAYNQLKLLCDIKAIFKRRGRKVVSYEKENNLLFDFNDFKLPEKVYTSLNSGSFRHVIEIVANSEESLDINSINDQCPDKNNNQIEKYLDEARELGMIIKSGNKYHSRPKQRNFGTTFEWYVAEICKRELSSFAYWGVTVEDLPGDYDVVLIRENQLGYIECKSKKSRNVDPKEIKNFLIRERALSPYFSIFLVDGISRENLDTYVDHAIQETTNYIFQIGLNTHEKLFSPPKMKIFDFFSKVYFLKCLFMVKKARLQKTELTLEKEEYDNFVQITPINTFFVSLHKRRIATAIKEIYRFLTEVRDKSLFIENKAAKENYGYHSPKL